MALRSRKKSNEQPDDPEAELAEAQLTEDDAAQAEAPAEDELTKLTRERAEYLEAWTRARADYQNLRRRLQADIDSSVGRAKESMLLELLLVLDFMDMALAAPVETQEAQNLKYGVEMTRNQMMTLLEREGVSLVPPTGLFDPDVHEAIEVVPHSELESGAIVETSRKGYRIGNRTLRHAHVRVAGDPTADEATPAEIDDTQSAD
ncbi:MAG: nucleotide exchange factor GrpE [Planctomycetes bacterium]|nr:nucleotide exchange factor GrpE [Planctomycetota bacterium]